MIYDSVDFAFIGYLTVIDPVKLRGLQAFGVTIALSLGAILIIAIMHASGQFAAGEAAASGLTDWFHVDLLILGNAALGGLLADACRWAFAACWKSWRRKTPTRSFTSRTRRSPTA